MATFQDLVNTILANGSAEYQARVPVATRDNIAEVGNPILEYSPTANEFLNALINRIAYTLVLDQQINNPMASLKKGSVPLGKDIQALFSNPAKAETFTLEGGDNLLARKAPDSMAEYYRLNRQDKYKVTVTMDMLALAFTSWDAFGRFVNGIVSTLYSGDNFDEFILFKNLMADGIADGKIGSSTVAQPQTEAQAKNFLTAVRTISGAMKFAGSNFNKYAENNPGANPVITWTPPENQILVIRNDIYSLVSVEALASAFNLPHMDYTQDQIIVVDNFGSAADTLALVGDRALFQVYENNSRFESFWNPEGLYWNYFWHHWQTFALSLFTNAHAIRAE